MKDHEREELERLIDKYSLSTVLDALADICWAKGEHVRCNWQDEALAKRWERMSPPLLSLSGKAEGL